MPLKPIEKRAARYRAHRHFRETVDLLVDHLAAGRLSQADLYDAVRVAIEMPLQHPLQGAQVVTHRDDRIADHTGVLPMESVPASETAARSIIPILWRRRADPESRIALRGWIDILRRAHLGQVP